jgi:predicted Zn-dependent protease with MMP-like domain
MDLDYFTEIMTEAIDGLPLRVLERLIDVTIDVEDVATPELAASLDIPTQYPEMIRGIYQRIGRAQRDGSIAAAPGRIVVFRAPFDGRFPDRATLIAEVQKTLSHEIMHHFGYGEKEAREAELWACSPKS